MYQFPLELAKNELQVFQTFADQYSKSMQVFNCPNDPEYFLRGGQGSSARMTLTYDKPYYNVTVSLKFFRIDSWDEDTDYFYVYVNKQICSQTTYSYKRPFIFAPSKCASPTYDEVKTNIVCTVKDLKVTQYPIEIDLKSNLDQKIDDESWGFREQKYSFVLKTVLVVKVKHNVLPAIQGFTQIQTSNATFAILIVLNALPNPLHAPNANLLPIYLVFILILLTNYQFSMCNNLVDNKCNKTCSSGYYEDKNTNSCQKCTQYCEKCQNSALCDFCQDQFFRTVDGQSCTSSCSGIYYGDPLTRLCSQTCSSPSYYKNQISKKCELCDNTCTTCENLKSNCTSCAQNKYIYKTQVSECVQNCPQYNFYADIQQMQCIPCYQGCKTCTGKNFDQCSECNTNHTLVDSTKCIRQDCGQFYFANTSTNQCQRCQVNCKVCQNETTCEECVKDKDISGQCQNPCDSGKYYSLSECVNCYPNCQECYGPNESQCLECGQDKILQDGKCICKEGFYQDDIQNGIVSCKKCGLNCKECSKDIQGIVICSSCNILYMTPFKESCNCKEGFILNDNGQCICKEYYFRDSNNECQPCHPSCKSCSGLGISDCIDCKIDNQIRDQQTQICTCKKGYFYNESTQQCDICHLTCESCKSSSSEECYSCLNQSGLNFVNHNSFLSKCECLKGFYFDSLLLKCLPCLPQCSQCNGGTENNCLSCQDSLMILQQSNTNSNGTCECVDTYFFNLEIKQCQKCHFSCIKCSGQLENQCSSCSDSNAELQKNKCVCKQGYFFDGSICQLCHSDCKSCTGPNNSDCTICLSPDMTPSKILADKRKCVCQESLYSHPSKGCIKCFGNCKKCDGTLEQNCLDCAEGTNFIKNENGKCVCDNGYYEPYSNSVTRTCLECNKLCNSCDRYGKCQTCKNQLMQFTQDKSTCECIKGYTLFENECTKCPPLCSKCLVQQDTKQVICQECNDPRNMERMADSSKCLCKQSYYPYGDSCRACSSICKTCSGGTEEDCIICSDEKKMIKDQISGICTCEKPLVFDESTHRCVYNSEKKCKDSRCLKCNETECIKCISNYKPEGDGCTCVEGKYDQGDKKGCQSCEQENCLRCQTASSCDICEPGLLKYQGKCFCPDSKFKDSQNQCSLNCPKKCKICSDPLNCYLTKEESDKNNYSYCDQSCNKCSGPSYYNCWECSSNTRIYNPDLRTCYCKEGYQEVYNKDCQQINQAFNKLSSGISISTGLLTFSSIFFSSIVESTLAFSEISGFSSLFFYSFSQYQSIGNLIFINKVFPMRIEQNIFQQFLKLNFFYNIPQQYVPMNEQTSKLNRVLQEPLNNQNTDSSTEENMKENLFKNPKFNMYGFDKSFLIVSFYPLLLILFTYLMTMIFYFLSRKSNFIFKAYEKAKWSFNLKTITLFSNLCLLSALINLKYFTEYSTSNKVNIISVSIFCALYFGGILYLIYKINFSSIILKPEDFTSYSCLHSKICQENLFSKNFWILIELRKVFQTIIIILVQMPLACILTLAFFSIIVSVNLIIKRPFLTRQMNIYLFIQELLLIVLYLSLSVFIAFSNSALYSGYALIISIYLFQASSFLGTLYFFGKWIMQCRYFKRNSLESSSTTQGLVKNILGTPLNYNIQQSLELADIKENQKIDESDLDLSLRNMDQQVKWNKNPILQQKQSAKARSQMATTISITKKNSALSSNFIKGQSAYKLKVQD